MKHIICFFVLASFCGIIITSVAPTKVMARPARAPGDATCTQASPQAGPASARIEPAGAPVQLRLAAEGSGYEGELSVTALTDLTELRVTNLGAMTSLDNPGAPAILAGTIQVTPDQAQPLVVGERRSFVVRMPKPALPGTFCGQVDVVYREAAGVGRATVQLQLQATSPNVDVDHNMLRLAQARPGDPYLGRFTANVTRGEVARLVITKRDLLLKNGQPGYIPASAITVSPDTLELTPESPLTFTVSLTSTAEGDYTGQLDLSFFGPSAVKAQQTRSITLDVTPNPQAKLVPADTAPLTITGYTGDSPNTVVTLREGSAATDAREVTGQLVGTRRKDDPSKHLPMQKEATKITIERDATSDVSVPLTFKGTRAGEYTGRLVIRSANAPEVTIPVVLNLKHWWLCPLLVLLAGIGLGWYVAWYTGGQEAWDTLALEISEEHDRLDEKQANDPRFYKFYGSYARSQLNAAADLLHDAWPAKKAEIEAIRDKVRDFRVIWHNYGVRLHEQRVRIEDTVKRYRQYHPHPYITPALRALDDIHEARHESKTGDELRAKVDVEVAKLENWQNVHDEIEKLNQLLEEHKDQIEKNKYLELKCKLAEQETNFEKAATELQLGAVQTELVNIRKELAANPRLRQLFADPANAMKAMAEAQVPTDAMLPIERLRAMLPSLQFRLSSYRKIIFFISLIVLGGFGMNELYVNNATFGASFFDYLKILLWGLGANATTSGFAQLISTYGAKVGLPGQGK